MRNIIDFHVIDKMIDLDLISFMGTLQTGMSASGVIQEEKWHPDSPKLADLEEDRINLQAAHDAAIYKDILKVAARKEARAKSIDTLKKMANNMELSFWDDPGKIAALGFPVKHQRTRNQAPLGVPASFIVLQGEHRGQVIGKVKPIPAAKFYEVRVTEGDPTIEESYAHFDSFSACSNMEFNGLTPTRQYSFCVRGRASKKVGPWSSPVTIIAT